MGSHLSMRGRLALAAFACSVAAIMGSAPVASAVQTDIYDPFIGTPACPTGAPVFNDPAFPGVICVASTTSGSSLTIGKMKAEIDSPTKLGFAFVFGFGEPEKCPETPACFRALPKTTVSTQESFVVRPPQLGKGKFPWWEKYGWPSKLFSVEAKIELAGEAHAFAPISLGSAPLLKLPVKIHLKNPLLGRNCYIGSNQNPIEFAFIPFSAPELSSGGDPNGFPVERIALNNFSMGDPSFAVPAAQGCGPKLGFGKNQIYLFDKAVNAAVGLPSPAGKNLLVHKGVSTALVTAPSGGLMQAAFNAAQLP